MRELSQDVEEVYYTRDETLFLDRYGDDECSLYYIS